MIPIPTVMLTDMDSRLGHEKQAPQGAHRRDSRNGKPNTVEKTVGPSIENLQVKRVENSAGGIILLNSYYE